MLSQWKRSSRKSTEEISKDGHLESCKFSFIILSLTQLNYYSYSFRQLLLKMGWTTSLLTEISGLLKNYFRSANGWEKPSLLDANINFCLTIFLHMQSDTVQETGISSNLSDYTDSVTIAIMIAFVYILKMRVTQLNPCVC
jgi:hypothetical protein